jgi:hypothetical protein
MPKSPARRMHRRIERPRGRSCSRVARARHPHPARDSYDRDNPSVYERDRRGSLTERFELIGLGERAGRSGPALAIAKEPAHNKATVSEVDDAADEGKSPSDISAPETPREPGASDSQAPGGALTAHG